MFKCKCIANRKIQFSLLSSQDALLLFLSSTTQFDKKMQPLYATPLAKRTGGSISYLKAKTKKKGRRREKKKKSFSVKASTTQCLKIISKVLFCNFKSDASYVYLNFRAKNQNNQNLKIRISLFWAVKFKHFSGNSLANVAIRDFLNDLQTLCQ